MTRLPVALAPTRASCLLSTTTTITTTQASSTAPSSLRAHARHATFIARPRRPYKFTQMVRLSDGSTYTMRTTSPEPLYRPAKDTRNALLWQPSDKSLRNVELDEAGRLAAFRERFGRGFDAAATAEEGLAETSAPASATAGASGTGDAFADLLAGYAPKDTGSMQESGSKKGPPGPSGKRK
ncbi:hypothetical protein ISF_01488 [Cordyceps fumosorosea ARSEF 2679]|uniref:Ribosomal protein bL31m N-terminal domain-containing protein n=1 Tax=Cordyceps fumosorosea (strain ARSEF 2679) TaxID=1081104 RepID=A0A168DBU7_CORFA|nr:hypothetical protein ISF_01488 [Cordyceps fumosorosea ARSEF 2679]OAA72415.1 hypothetical protein ISF_01488 [Cordyceps fumosorosea ARSEF 2679]